MSSTVLTSYSTCFEGMIDKTNTAQQISRTHPSMPTALVDPRRLVGVHAERVTDVSSTDFPGHYPDEDHSWNLAKFRKVRAMFRLFVSGV